MTDVLTLPATLSAAGAHRLLGQLERDLAAGLDPGPRGAQIAFLTGSLTRAVGELRQTLPRVIAEMPAGDPTARHLCEAAAGMMRIAEAVMGCVDTYRHHPAAA